MSNNGHFKRFSFPTGVESKPVEVQTAELGGDEEVEKGSQGYFIGNKNVRALDIYEPDCIKLDDDEVYTIYRANDWIFSVVNRIVNDCVKAVPKVVPKDDGAKVSGRMKSRIKEIQKFLDNPNDNKESFSNIREKTIRNLLVFGKAATEKVLTDVGKLKEIYALSPQYIKVRADVHGNLPTFRTYLMEHPNDSKLSTYFNFNELIFMTLLNTTESMYGIKIIDVIANTIASDILRTDYNAHFFVNGAEASGIMTLEGMHKNDLKRFKAGWASEFKGTKNSHKLAFTNVPAKYVKMALTNKDIEFSEYGIELRNKIFSAYGMQPIIMGVIDGTTGKLNSQEQIDSYKDGALRPILSKESYYYTQEIVNMGFGYDDLKIEFPTIDFLDKKTQTEIDNLDIEAGTQTINEVRARRNMPRVEWGDTPIVLTPGGGQVGQGGDLIPPSKKPNNSKKPQTKPQQKPQKDINKYIDSLTLKLLTIKIMNGFIDDSYLDIILEESNDNRIKNINHIVRTKIKSLKKKDISLEMNRLKERTR